MKTPTEILNRIQELENQIKAWEANGTYSINLGIAAATEKLQKDLDVEKKWSEELARDICEMEDALGFKQDQTDKHGAFIPTKFPWKERVRDLIAKEGELGDVKAELEQALKACAEMRDALEWFQCETCQGTKQFTFECPGCLSGDAECTCKDQKPEPCPQCQQFPDIQAQYAKRDHALSTDCGKGYIHVRELEPTKKLLRDICNAILNTFEQRKQAALGELRRLEALKGE